MRLLAEIPASNNVLTRYVHVYFQRYISVHVWRGEGEVLKFEHDRCGGAGGVECGRESCGVADDAGRRGLGLEVKGGYDAETICSAAQGVEDVWISGGGGMDEGAVGEDDVHGDYSVEGEACYASVSEKFKAGGYRGVRRCLTYPIYEMSTQILHACNARLSPHQEKSHEEGPHDLA